MMTSQRLVRATYIGGPTILLELGGLRLLTDPTFDPAGSEYTTPVYTLRKTQGPAISADALGSVDVMLLSHDHHFDNLDRAGRALLSSAGQVITTPAGAGRLGPPTMGVEPWQTMELVTPNAGRLHVTATPARHGPADGDRGPVTGFMLTLEDAPDDAIYISGDTVWYDGVADVARRFHVRLAVLFMGAARVREVGPAHLTFEASEVGAVAHAFPDALIVPVHFEGWEHFSEGRPQIERAFAAAGVASRVRWLERGMPTLLSLGASPSVP
jgi:L-ascorbate metabolism protein UlaG (beta-lactamase superfamily)